MIKPDLKSEIANREAVFRLLSVCYYQPCALWNEEQLISNLGIVCSLVSTQAAASAQAMLKAWETSDIEGLTVEYARLFVGPHALLSPPYGSVYLEQGKQVMGESTLAVLQFYRECGLSMDAEFTEMPDHIAVELEFISYLLQRAKSADSQDGIRHWLDQAGRFMERFLACWCGRFCAAIRSNTDSPFYKALADVTEIVVSSRLPALTV